MWTIKRNRNFTSVFGDRTSFRAKGLRWDGLEIAILPQFLAIEPHFVRKGCAGTRGIAILPQFLAIEPHFVRKGARDDLEVAILPQFLAIEPHFVRKGCDGTAWKSQFYSVFRRLNLISCERVALGQEESQFYPSFGDRTSFRAKGLQLDN